jgi:short-subunit dehydrogenase
MASVAGYRGLPYAAAYCSSKASLINLAESMYNLCKKKNILIRVINPGFIKTPLTDKNEFPMPLIMSVDKAAKVLFKKLNYSKNVPILQAL